MDLKMTMVTGMGLLGLSLGVPTAEFREAEKEAQFQPLPISMSLAVRAAETVAPGQAMHAQLEIAQGRPVYEIDILGLDQSLNTVQVGAEDGNVVVVISKSQDQAGQVEPAQQRKRGGV